MSAAAKADTDLEAFRLEARKWLEENVLTTAAVESLA